MAMAISQEVAKVLLKKHLADYNKSGIDLAHDVLYEAQNKCNNYAKMPTDLLGYMILLIDLLNNKLEKVEQALDLKKYAYGNLKVDYNKLSSRFNQVEYQVE